MTAFYLIAYFYSSKGQVFNSKAKVQEKEKTSEIQNSKWHLDSKTTEIKITSQKIEMIFNDLYAIKEEEEEHKPKTLIIKCDTSIGSIIPDEFVTYAMGELSSVTGSEKVDENIGKRISQYIFPENSSCINTFESDLRRTDSTPIDEILSPVSSSRRLLRHESQGSKVFTDKNFETNSLDKENNSHFANR